MVWNVDPARIYPRQIEKLNRLGWLERWNIVGVFEVGTIPLRFRLTLGYRMAHLGSCCSSGPSGCIHAEVAGRGFLSHRAVAAMAGLP